MADLAYRTLGHARGRSLTTGLMSSSDTVASQRFFGLDLRQTGAQWRRVAEALARTPVARAFAPGLVVRLLRDDGVPSLWLARDQQLKPLPSSASESPPAFDALELPQDLFLWRSLVLPRLSDAELADAVALDLASASPFAPRDLVSGHVVRDGTEGTVQVDAVLASRTQVDAWLSGVRRTLATSAAAAEVWAVAGLPAPVPLAGYGDQRRATTAARKRCQNLALAALAALLLGALAVTPTLQLRARAIAAGHAFERLHADAAPAVAQRDLLVQQAEKAAVIGRYVGSHADSLKVIHAITRAVPDDAWLTILKIDGLTVSLVGNATNVATLLRSLEQMPGARDVRATSAAMRRRDGDKETFTIEIKLDPSVYARVPPLPGASS